MYTSIPNYLEQRLFPDYLAQQSKWKTWVEILLREFAKFLAASNWLSITFDVNHLHCASVKCYSFPKKSVRISVTNGRHFRFYVFQRRNLWLHYSFVECPIQKLQCKVNEMLVMLVVLIIRKWRYQSSVWVYDFSPIVFWHSRPFLKMWQTLHVFYSFLRVTKGLDQSDSSWVFQESFFDGYLKPHSGSWMTRCRV